jgi:hypothetical protein
MYQGNFPWKLRPKWRLIKDTPQRFTNVYCVGVMYIPWTLANVELQCHRLVLEMCCVYPVYAT